MNLRSQVTVIAGGVVLILSLAACSNAPEGTPTSGLGNHFEQSNPNDDRLDDGSGNELEVGANLTLPQGWPEGVPTPSGSLIAVSVIDDRTAVATWTVKGDVFTIQKDFLNQFDSTFTVEPIADLSTDTIVVFGAIGNGYDITISATLGEQVNDPGEITLLVNPSI
jgi:hypothetical protein